MGYHLTEIARIMAYMISIPLWGIIVFNWINHRSYLSALLGIISMLRLLFQLSAVALGFGLNEMGFIQDLYTAIAVLLPIGLLGYLYDHRFHQKSFWLEDKDERVLAAAEKGAGSFLVSAYPWLGRRSD